MTMEEAREFLNRLIAESRDQATFANVNRDRLIETAEGNPLILQWIVGQIDLAQDPDEVLEDLSHGEGSAAERVFDRSYNLPQLNTGARALLLALSLFVPSVTRAALAEVAGMGKEKDRKRFREAVRILAALWLIYVTEEGMRLAVRGVTRELAKARLSTDPRAKVFRQRFIARFLNYAESHNQPTPADLNALEVEKDNLLTAADMAYELKNHEAAMRLPAALFHFLNVRGYWNEAIKYGEQAAFAARQMKNDLAAARLEENVAVIRMRQGEYIRAKQALEHVLGVYRNLGSEIGISSTLHNLARIAQELGDVAEARRLYNESLELSEALGNRAGIAHTLQQLGRISQVSGDFGEARRLYSKSLELSNELGSVDIVSEAKQAR